VTGPGVRPPERAPRPRSRAALAAALAASVLAVWLAAGYGRDRPAAAATAAGLSVEGRRIALASDAPQWRFVKLATAEPARLRWTDPQPARIGIDQARASKVGVAVTGRVTRVFVELGERVRKGQPLFTVSSPEVAELKAEREKAAVDVEAARATFERVRALVASHAVPAKEEATAGQQLRQAEVAQRLAESKMQSLSVLPSAERNCDVSSPRDGLVVEKNVLVDQQVSPDSSGSLMVVADLSWVWVTAEVFEAEAAGIRPGDAAQVTSPAFPGVALEGRVDMVSSVADPARHTLPVRVRLANPAGILRPNVYAQVRFAAPPRPDAVEVPGSAVLFDGARQYVYVEDGRGGFVRRDVTTGPAREGRVTVLSGLDGGQKVVAEGAVLLDNQLDLSE
jgi:cobalt-zinc-cadmium efflux system membrane fusion protein